MHYSISRPKTILAHGIFISICRCINQTHTYFIIPSLRTSWVDAATAVITIAYQVRVIYIFRYSDFDLLFIVLKKVTLNVWCRSVFKPFEAMFSWKSLVLENKSIFDCVGSLSKTFSIQYLLYGIQYTYLQSLYNKYCLNFFFLLCIKKCILLSMKSFKHCSNI